MAERAQRCPDCGGVVCSSIDPIPFELRGETVVVTGLEHLACEKCGEVLLGLETAGELQTEAVRLLKRRKGLLSSSEIRELRLSLGLSQAGFERLLGTGPKTVVRWEKGTVFQSATADNLMRLIRQMPEAVKFLRGSESETEVPLAR